MAVFTFSEPQHVFNRKGDQPSLLRKVFDLLIDARMAQVQREVNAHLDTLGPEARAKYNIEAFGADKKGVWAWPY